MSPNGPARLAEAVDVRRVFGSTVAVDGVTLHVEAGEVVGLLGANGAGKTTLLRMVLGLLPVTSGAVRQFGEIPSRASRRRLGYVPQGLGLYDDLTVEENLRFAAGAYGAPMPALERELEANRHTPVGALPLGVQRRVAFAKARCHEPTLLILDEPTSGVDVLGRARLWDEIRGEAESGVGVLVTTHNMEEAEQCDRLVVMVAGSVAASGSMASIVAGRTAIEVGTADWERAFEALDDAGFPVSLVGRTIRVPGVREGDVGAALARARVQASLKESPASFEEAFVSLTTGGP